MTASPRVQENGFEHQLVSQPRRINVAVSRDTVEALQNVIDRESVSLTEAVRQLAHYGYYLYRVAKIERRELLVKDEGGTSEIIVL